jgi:hypothetical protein
MKVILDDFCAGIEKVGNGKITNLIPAIIDAIEGKTGTLVIGIDGSRDCISGDSLISTPKGDTKIKDFQGGIILSWNGKSIVPSYACKPIKHCKKTLYKVTLENGYQFSATKRHFVLSTDGYVPLEDLTNESYLICPSLQYSNLDTYLSMSCVSVQHWFALVLGWLYNYLKDCRPDGELLRSELNTYLEIFPLLTDAEISVQNDLHMDVLLELLHKLLHDGHKYIPVSNSHYLFHNEGQHYANVDNCIYAKLSGLLDELSQAFDQSLLSYNHHDKVNQFLTQIQALLIWINQDENLLKFFGLQSFSFDDNSFSYSYKYKTDYIHKTRVKSIEKLEEDYYYDLFVPYYHSYIANGLIHHNSAKSNTIARIISSMINNQFILSMQIAATATNLLDSGFGSLIADFTDGIISPKHILNTPAEIDLVGFHESRGERIKDSQKKYDVTIIDETGNWGIAASISALTTWAKHSKVIIIIANRIPSHINSWIEASSNFRRIRVDYWENPFCPKDTVERHEKLRINNPQLWKAQVLYSSNVIDGVPIFGVESVEEALKMNKGAVPEGVRDIISIDVGGESGDEHCIIHLRQTKDGHIFFSIEKFYNANQAVLSRDVKYIRSDTGSITEVWDASGGGSNTLDFHCPARKRWIEGIFEFRGNDNGCNNKYGTEYYNRRSESYYLTSRLCGDGLLQEELLATIQDKLESKDNKVAEKAVIKKMLGGRSPNISDALTMGIWYLLTQPVDNDTARESQRYGNMTQVNNISISGAPGF